jgi:TolB-like protein/DNA-binding winged helix-turn-helix (wHTH) protein/Flp pilus assembly protein TadD
MNAPAGNRDEQALAQGFRLGELRIDPNAGEVSGPGGREKLDPKVMDVLVMLARSAGHVVLREDLLTRLWPNSAVTDESLSRCIYELRRQLALAGGDDRYKAMLETVPKRGYRLNAEVTPLASEPDARSAARPKWPLVAVAAVATIVIAVGAWFALVQRPDDASTYSVAVLAFDDLSSEQDQAYFSDGVSEEIIYRLNKTRALKKIISRKSSFSFKGRQTSIAEIAGELDVTHVVEGSVRKSGNRVRITARLVEASSNSQLWSKTYDRELGDLFAVQDEIAGAIAMALNATLSGNPEHAPILEAQNLFQQGQLFYNRLASGDIELSVKYYKDALAIDPDYARAWAALAGAYSLLAASGDMPKAEALEEQGKTARKAVELDPYLAAGHARLAQYYFDIGDRRTSYRIFDKAIALDPDDLLVLSFAAGIAMRNGDTAEAIGRYDRIVALDPLSARYHANHGTYLLAADRFNEAKAELKKAQELSTVSRWDFDLAIARILILQKEFDEARSVIARLSDVEARDHGLALLYYAEGRQADADAALGRLVGESAAIIDIRLAEVYAFRGMIDDAFRTLDTLKEAVERNEPAEASDVWSLQVELRVSPFLKPLHADPRWQALVFEPA